MSQNQRSGINTFSGAESRFQERFGALRGRVFLQLLKLFIQVGISPDHLSIIGILVMFLLPLGFIDIPIWCIVAYGVHLLADGLDGSLARYQGTVTARGAYLDIVVDHFALIATVLTLQWFQIVDPFWLLLYTVCYLILIVHFVLMNARGCPPTFPVIRTKYPLFLLTILIGYSIITPIWINYFLMICGIYYALMVAVYITLYRWTLPS